MMAVKTYLAELCYNSLKKYISSAVHTLRLINLILKLIERRVLIYFRLQWN